MILPDWMLEERPAVTKVGKIAFLSEIVTIWKLLSKSLRHIL